MVSEDKVGHTLRSLLKNGLIAIHDKDYGLAKSSKPTAIESRRDATVNVGDPKPVHPRGY